jgi:hypothetical protein
MDANRLVQMAVNMLMRKLMGKGMKMLSQRMARPGAGQPKGAPDLGARGQEAAKRAQDMAKLNRRLW